MLSLSFREVKEAVLAGQQPEFNDANDGKKAKTSTSSAVSPELAKGPPKKAARKKKEKEKSDGANVSPREGNERKEENARARLRNAKLQDLVRNMTSQEPERRPTLDKVRLYLFLCENM